jgi:uncharacterized protein
MYLTKYLLMHQLNENQSLAVNTLSGAIDVIENRFLPLLENSRVISSDCEIYEALLERGYLFDSEAEEQAAINKLFGDYAGRHQPMTFVICPTYSCNLRCVYCFEGSLPIERPRMLSIEEVDAVFAAISRLATSDSHIQLFGGEPLLANAEPIVTHIFKRAAALGYPVSAVTNGVNVAHYMPLFREYRDHLDDFQITVDGPAAIHDVRRPRANGKGTFSDIIDGIQLLLNEGMRVRMRVNVDRMNIDGLADLADFVIAKGWHKLENFGALLSPVDDHGGHKVPGYLAEHEAAAEWFRLKAIHPQLEIFRVDLFRNLEYLINAVNPKGIKFPRFQYCESNNLSCYTFGTDGKIYLCAEAVGDDRHAVGRYYPEYFLNEAAISQWNGRSILTLEKCRECPIATLCGGGCAISAARINGSLDDPCCAGAIESVHSYLDSIKEQFLKSPVSA